MPDSFPSSGTIGLALAGLAAIDAKEQVQTLSRSVIGGVTARGHMRADCADLELPS